MSHRIRECGSYDETLTIMMEYIHPVPIGYVPESMESIYIPVFTEQSQEQVSEFLENTVPYLDVNIIHEFIQHHQLISPEDFEKIEYSDCFFAVETIDESTYLKMNVTAENKTDFINLLDGISDSHFSFEQVVFYTIDDVPADFMLGYVENDGVLQYQIFDEKSVHEFASEQSEQQTSGMELT